MVLEKRLEREDHWMKRFRTKYPYGLNDEDTNKPAQLPRELQNKESRPVITYKLTNTVRNIILKYKDTVNPIYVEGKI